MTASFQKSIAFNHVVFQSADSRSNMSNSCSGVSRGAGGGFSSKSTSAAPSGMGRHKPNKPYGAGASLWSNAVATGFHKTR